MGVNDERTNIGNTRTTKESTKNMKQQEDLGDDHGRAMPSISSMTEEQRERMRRNRERPRELPRTSAEQLQHEHDAQLREQNKSKENGNTLTEVSSCKKQQSELEREDQSSQGSSLTTTSISSDETITASPSSSFSSRNAAAFVVTKDMILKKRAAAHRRTIWVVANTSKSTVTKPDLGGINHCKPNSVVSAGANQEEAEMDSDDSSDEPTPAPKKMLITRKEAMERYCLPASTVDHCCNVVKTKSNPFNDKFQIMKLYSRKEIRKWSYQRYGGRAGLQQERANRQQKLLAAQLDKAKQAFR
jgi:hypothetical protein